MPDPYGRDRRVGRWAVVSREFHERGATWMEKARAIQADVLVIAVHHDLMIDHVEYVGISEHFDPVPVGMKAPLYAPRFERDKNNKWHVVGWGKVDG